MKKDKASSSNRSLLARWKNRDQKFEGLSKSQEIPEGEAVPLSSEQKRLWFLQQLNPTNSFYNYSELYRFDGDVDVSIFEKSIRLIEDRHDILRTIYPIKDGAPVVKVLNNSRSKFTHYDLSQENKEVALKKAQKIIKENAQHTFNLSNEILLRSIVIKIASNSYFFFIVMHHINTDKWSMKVFRKELAYNYACLIQEKKPSLQKLELQYANYAYWQSKKPLNNEHLSYWKEKLSGDLPILNLYTDHPKKVQPSYKGTFHKNDYDSNTSGAFFELCKKLETTPYVTMLSIYYILLNKYSGQSDILIGTPITKREHSSIEDVIGFFNDTLVLRTTVTNSISFKDLVKEVKRTTLEAFAHKDISFDTLVKTLKPDRRLNVHPFFQVMFLYHKVPETPKFGSNINVQYEPYDAGVAKFDLTLYISEDQGSLMSLMEYETDLFESSTIARMHKHFELILKDVISAPERLISTISIVTEEEASFYSSQEKSLEKYHIPQHNIHSLITAQALNVPDAIALSYQSRTVTYRELESESDRIASYLISEGIKKNDIVGLCIERSTEMVVALLGILKAGGAYLPLDPNYPSERISYILGNAFAKALVTQQNLLKNFTDFNVPVITLENCLSEDLKIKNTFPVIEETDLAYVIYTSGSSGKPKGVPITHGNILNSTLARTEFYDQDPSVFLLMSSISFDSSKAGIFWSLCTGGNLVISEKHLEQDIHKLEEVIKTQSVSHTLMLPSLYIQLLNYGQLAALSSLKTVIVAGEVCNPQLVQTHFEIVPKVRLYNEYGPTESTVWCIAHKIEQEDAFKTVVPIGKPIKNIHILILDKFLHKVPYGIPGELYIGGLSLANGYVNAPEKTEQFFIENPFKHMGCDTLYRTGDLARYNKKGAIEFLGRKDQQVKIRGYRIELDEIEQVLQSLENISQAVVVVKNNTKAIDWSELENCNTERIIEVLQKHSTTEEVESILNSIEALPESTLDVVIQNLD